MTQLGCIADDFTGGTDVAAALRRSGLRVLLLFGVPEHSEPSGLEDCDAVVVALKSRTIAAHEAVEVSLRAWTWLRDRGVQRTYFKYCSTFDSTEKGNIGPVTEALLEAMGATTTLVCPASPEHGRTTYRGHHFVGDQLLSESSMRTHPLTPMTDPDLVAVMGRQSRRPVGLLPLDTVRQGSEAASTLLEQLRSSGIAHVVVDATQDDDLVVTARAAVALPLVTGGAGLAGALGQVLAEGGTHVVDDAGDRLPSGPGVVLAGSCSRTTLAQVDRARSHFDSHRLDPTATPDPRDMLERARTWLRQHWGQGPLVVYSSASPEDQRGAREAMGPDTADHLERTLAELAREAAALGAGRVVVAGGETSGAVVQALGYRSVTVLAEEDRGVPWCAPVATTGPVVLLKSGNFGQDDLLVRSMRGTT